MTQSDSSLTENTRTAIRAINTAAIDAHAVLHAMRGLGPKANAVLWQKAAQTHPWQILEDKFIAIHDATESIDQKILGYTWVIGKVRAYSEFLSRQDIAEVADSTQQAELAQTSQALRDAVSVLREYAIGTLHVSPQAVDEDIEQAYSRFKAGFDSITPRQSTGLLDRARSALGWNR